ncbi:polysaccharide biosynthesis/export family protein [Variovorax dokdonensis]|uniref:polysaccharide biosynthesis/export family protein n=1 Tax=Variovorax dokdonensis TaxID=344883 RepID=UPI0034A3E600
MSDVVSRIRWPLSLLLMIMLGGCAWAPGVFFDKSATQPLGDPGTTAPINVADSDRPPEGALRDITPEFIRAQRQALPQDVGADVRGLFAEAAAYRIGPGDILNIVVWDHPELSLQPAGSLTTDAISASPVSNGYNVSQDGLIQFPYVGSFKVGGLTEYEVRDGLLKKLTRYFSEPKLTVRVQFLARWASRSHRCCCWASSHLACWRGGFSRARVCAERWSAAAVCATC